MEAVQPTPLLPKGALVRGRVQPPPTPHEYWSKNPHLNIRQVSRDLANWENQYQEQESKQ